MLNLKPITIVGGGVAGLALGIGLRQRGIPVTLWESKRYPRHRVCGEFISGRGQKTLVRLGLIDRLKNAGAIWAQNAKFFQFATKNRNSPNQMPQPALCLSRFFMDELLARHFQESGGELREGERWKEANTREGVVHASGRRLEPAGVQASGGRLEAAGDAFRWFGLKVHARNVPLAADLEMHLQPDGYVGLCRLKDETVNVCGLFRRGKNAATNQSTWQEKLRGAPASSLRYRLAEATFDTSTFCSVAGLSLQPHLASDQNECCIGDALTMIPPATGNGMSMAFESAELAIDPLDSFSRGEISWSETKQEVARTCDNRFRQRLSWAKWLQWMMFAPAFQGTIGDLALNSGMLWRLMFARTR